MKMEENKENKGLWALLQEEKLKGNVIHYDAHKGVTLDEIADVFKEMWKSDMERRERMDKEYTDIGKVTLKEIEDELAKWDGDVPNGLFCKIKVAGSYQTWPIKVLHQYLLAVEKEVKKWKDAQTENSSKKGNKSPKKR